MANLNIVAVTGNLTRDPELRTTAGGTSVCSMRIAVNDRWKNPTSGEFEDRPNYFNVTAWGGQAENCNRFLSKGRAIAVDGSLRWHEWTDKESGKKREAIEINADMVQFLQGGERREESVSEYQSDVPVDLGDFEPATTSVPATDPDDDDIPF